MDLHALVRAQRAFFLDFVRSHPQWRERMKAAARRSAEAFSAEEFARRAEEIYRGQLERMSRGEEVSA